MKSNLDLLTKTENALVAEEYDLYIRLSEIESHLKRIKKIKGEYT